MSGALRLRLSTLMFLQYAALGSWCVTLPSLLLRSAERWRAESIRTADRLVVRHFCDRGDPVSIDRRAFGRHAFFDAARAGRIAHCRRLLLVLDFSPVPFSSRRDGSGVSQIGVRRARGQRRALALSLGARINRVVSWSHQAVSRPQCASSPRTSARAPNWLGLNRVKMGDTSFVGHWNSPAEATARLDVLNREIGPALDRIRQHPELIAQRDCAFLPLFWLLLAYNLCYLPSVTLANSICFRNLPQPERQFGQARVFGTIGWIAALVLVGWSFPPISPRVTLAAIITLLLAAVCLTLPHTPPLAQPKTIADWIGWPAFARWPIAPF